MANPQLSSERFAQLLFGRGEELDWLEREVNARDHFSPDIPIVVVGEAGIGKTALVADFFAHESRIPPLWVACHEWTENTPDFKYALDTREITGRDRRGATLVLDGAEAVTERRVNELYSRAINYKLIRKVVVTSRKEVKFPRGERVLRLAGLPDSDARRWLQRIVGNERSDEASILDLLRAANGHPLSLVT
jgi:AAA ATPase domain